MNYNSFTKKSVYLVIVGLVCLCSLVGCGQKDYKEDADERVYNIIDEKWQDDFGSKANYKISDTQPSPNDIQIEKAVPASGVLTLSRAVALATAHNRQYQTQKETLYIRALDLRLFQHNFESQFFSGARQGYGKEGNDEGIGGEADVGFGRLLADGTRIGAKVGLAWFNVLTGNPEDGMASILSATITKPLLRGSDRKIVLENLTQAERNTLYQIRLFNRFRKTFVVEVITGYYQVLQLFDEAKNAENNYNTLLDIYTQVEKLVNAGRLPHVQLDRVHQEKFQARDIYIQAKKDYEEALDEFKFWQLSLPANVDFQLDVNELEALRSAGLSKPEFSEAEAVETALAERLDLANNSDAIADAERKVLVAADGLRGKLNIFAGTDVTSLSRDSRLSGVGALDDDFVTDRDRPNPFRRLRDNNPLRNFSDKAVVGIDGELPLDRVAEQNIYRKALINLTQRQREFEQMADWVTLEVSLAYRNLTEAMHRYEVQSAALELAQKRLESTSLLLQYNRTSSRRILNAQDDLFDARNDAAEALTDYTIATLNFYSATGVLQVKPDGMWEI